MMGFSCDLLTSTDGPTVNPQYQSPKKPWVGLTEKEKLELKNSNMPTMALIETVCSLLRMKNYD
jgi:hypothetical protein